MRLSDRLQIAELRVALRRPSSRGAHRPPGGRPSKSRRSQPGDRTAPWDTGDVYPAIGGPVVGVDVAGLGV